MKIKNLKAIEVRDWDKLVQSTYGKPYCFQQQNDCRERGVFHLTIPTEYPYEDEMNDEIPEKLNDEIMGVKFEKWLERDPIQCIFGETDYFTKKWWHRNFYPNVHTIANDLHKKGLIEKGDYLIEIDW